MDMICGGQAEVLLDCVSPTEVNRTVFDRWRRMLDDGQKGSLLTLVTGAENTVGTIAHCLATTDGVLVGDFPLPDMEREKVLSLAAESSAVRTLALNAAFVVI
jgi:xanthine dehydrogenase accessory factor